MSYTLLTHKQHCVLCTQDPELEENLSAYLQDLYIFWPCTNPLSALSQLERRSNCLVVVDLRFDDSLALLAALSRRKQFVTIALGNVDTVPYQDAVNLGLYAVADIEETSGALQGILEQAARHLASLEELNAHAHRLAEKNINPMLLGMAGASSMLLGKLDVISEVLEKLNTSTGLIEMVLKEVSKQYLPSSIGIFALNEDHYVLQCGLRCAEESWSYRFGLKDSFIQWLKIHGQLISRKGLASLDQSETRLMLGQVLDTLSADMIIPLSQGSSLLGWLFMGRQINGESYSQDHLPHFLSIADLLSGILKFASVSERKKTLYHISQGIIASLPFGLMVVDDKRTVIWSNERSRNLLGISEDELRREVDFIDTILADVVHRAAGNSGKVVGGERQGGGGARIFISGSCLETDTRMVLVLIEDIDEKFNSFGQSERIMEIIVKFKSSLTAIKSFSQLLPDKHTDPRFIDEFGVTVDREVEALLRLSKQLTNFGESSCLS